MNVWDRMAAQDRAIHAAKPKTPQSVREAIQSGDWTVAPGAYLADVWDPTQKKQPDTPTTVDHLTADEVIVPYSPKQKKQPETPQTAMDTQVNVPAPKPCDFSNPYLVADAGGLRLCVTCGWATWPEYYCTPKPGWRESFEQLLAASQAPPVGETPQRRIYPDFTPRSPLAAALESPTLGAMNRPQR